MRKLDEVLSGKGWDTRKKILEQLYINPTTAYDLAKKLNLNYSTVRYHLDLLERSGLVNHKTLGSKQLYLATKSALSLKII
ncbi:ArsR/SmtB family transcription factor [Metallosphaera cuprina]|uniref:Regulatory protein, ArsR n=1 Tax=Metallosphaera cuprina (strain Ar-4) TaxID=1006006 RepID=F4FYI5_METCR|nr:winged helix-turn-helix domain-containing protein [Metallosphaera cuprina]AEB95483.1 regulatory protein, ArsR [Metallosphaera cuprina Ar-4]